MWRTAMCRFGVGNWIFLFACLHLFTYAQGGEEQLDPGVRFTAEPSDAVVAAGDGALLACAVAAHRPLRLAWRHSTDTPPTRDQTVTENDKYRKQLPNGSLSIEEMSPALAGHYQCVATVDGVGTILSRVATVFLAEVPEVSGGPRSILSAAGGGALLPCGVRAPPRLALRLLTPAPPDRRVYGAARLHNAPPLLKLNVTWLKNGSPMRVDGARMALTASGALEIEPLRAHDAARYACRVSLPNAHHVYKVSEETELRVSTETGNAESPPRFIATPQPVTVMEGASVTFDCAAVGNPKPEITWLNNGVAIDLSDLDSRFYLVGAGSLRVQWARALDAGAYTCRAHSRLDSADHTTQLAVLTAPRVHVPDGAVVTARERGDVTLRCDVRGKPAPAVTWLKDGDPLTPNNHDITLVDGTSLRIAGVLRVDAGMFQCAAASRAGAAAAALRLRVLPPNDDFIPASPSPPEPELPEDFLGETSSAYTSGPDTDTDTDPDTEYYDVLHGQGVEPAGNGSAPPPPRRLRAVIVKHTFVTLSWQEPDGADDVTGYAVIYRVKGSQRERVVRGAAQRHEMNVPALRPNTTYLFSVLAHTARGLSPPTDPIEVHTTEEELTHGPPLNVRAEPLGPHALRVSWAPPRSAPAPGSAAPAPAPPSKYSVHYTEVESGREQVQWVEAAGGAALSTTLSALRAAALYHVRVAAAGGAPADLRARTPSDAPAAPPLNVTAQATGATSILVRWEAPPARTHRGALTGYKLRYRAAPPAPAPAPAAAPGAPAPAPPAPAPRRKADSLTTPADARRAELRGLDPATTYQVRVCAINANGSGPFSEWVSASTQPPRAPHAPRDESRVPPPPPPLTTRAGRDWISVWWSEEGAGGGWGGEGDGDGEGGGVVRGYVLGWGLGVPDDTSRELPPHLHSHVIRGLESNSEYVISLRASNSRGLGPAVYATVRTKPAADDDELGEGEEEDEGEDDDGEGEGEDLAPPLIPPVGLKAIMLSGTTAVVYWTDPTLPKGQTAADGRRYVVRWEAAGLRARTFNATDVNCMLSELRPFTHYEFTVKLIKGGRESSWSMVVSNTTLEAAPGSAPRELRAAPPPPPASPARALDLVWAPPAKPNGFINGYVIMYAVQRSGAGAGGGGGGGAGAGGEEWTVVVSAGERTRARVERLRARTTYLIKVQAKNSMGVGPFSAPLAYTTAMEPGEGGGLASATSAWLWASAGGACAVLALAAALALSLCCRRSQPPLSPDTSTYQKSSASAGIKPPDLWIHHDQMELKHMDKSLHSSASKISAGSMDGGGAGAGSTLTLTRAPPAEYEPARHAPPASLDRRHYVPTYVESRCSSAAGSGSDDTAVLRASPASLPPLAPYAPLAALAPHAPLCRRCDKCDKCDYAIKPMTGMGVGVGVGGVSCASTCERRQHARMPHPDQSTPLLAGVAPLGSPQSSLASLHPLHPHHPQHPPPAPCEWVGLVSAGRGVLGAGRGRGGRGGGGGRHRRVRVRGARARTLRRVRAARTLHAPRLAGQRAGGGRGGRGGGRLAAAAGGVRRAAAQLRAGHQLRPLHAHALALQRQCERDVAIQEERQLLSRTHPEQTAARRCRVAVRGGAGAADAVAQHGAAAPRDAEPGGAHEGPVRHHAAPVPLLVPASPPAPALPLPAALPVELPVPVAALLAAPLLLETSRVNIQRYRIQ